jgi:hypothetical protein
MLTMPEVSKIVKEEMLQDKKSDNPRWTHIRKNPIGIWK